MKNKKQWIGLVPLVALAILLTLSPVTAQSEPATIQLWRIFNECGSTFEGVTELGDTTDVCAVQQVLANQWNAEHPELQVETTSLVWPGIVELNAALAAGTPPDIMSLHAFRIPAYASRGILTPLTSYLEEAGVDVNDLLPNVREAVTYNGEIYAIPFDVHGILWHINLDLWDQAGLLDADGAPLIPAGVEEFEAACQQVLEATGSAIFGGGEDDIVGTEVIWFSIYAQMGGSVADESGMPSVNTPLAVEALELQMRLRDAGCFSSGELGSTYEGFNQGAVAGVNAGTWMVNEFDAQVRDPDSGLKNLYVAPYPQFGSAPAVWGGSHTWVVPLGANADPERVRAAVQYIKFFYDNQLAWSRTGHASVRQSVLDSAEYQALPHHNEYTEFANQVVYFPKTGWVTAIDQIMHEEIQAAILGEKTPEQALNDAQSRLMDIASFQ
ncbi:MAG: extracellular solute-binding protein [Chloroflexi bacterium]|nr:extracellular solute-binding protein [Chloroflexota bacterium]